MGKVQKRLWTEWVCFKDLNRRIVPPPFLKWIVGKTPVEGCWLKKSRQKSCWLPSEPRFNEVVSYLGHGFSDPNLRGLL